MSDTGKQSSTIKSVGKDYEISLKELILKTREWFHYLLGKWKIILIFSVLGAGGGVLWSILAPVRYKASLTFVLDESNNSLSSYAGLASQLGINLNTAGGENIFQGDNIIQFLQSRLMIENTLMTVGDFDGKKETLADNFLSWSDLEDDLKKDTDLMNVRFPSSLSVDKFSLQQNKVMTLIYKNIIKDKLEVDKPDKKLSFIQVTCTTVNELFSKYFTERLMKQAADFYVNTKTKQVRESVDKLQQQSDSVLRLLNKKTIAAATTQDMNLNPALSITNVPVQMASRDQSILMATYAELEKNLSLAKISLVQQTPIIQMVDTPVLPLERVKLGKLKGLIIGGVLGVFLIGLVLTFKCLYNDIMEY